MTENTTAGADLAVVNPITGEVLDLTGAPTTDLAGALERLGDVLMEVAAFRQRLVDELAARLDREASRSARVGDYTLETNAPTVEDYLVDVMRAELQELVDAGVIAQAVVDRVIVTPPPKPQDPRVDKREVNKLKRSDDRRVTSAIARARQVNSATRTVRVKRVEEA